ncbi:MAG: hypothetical protein K6T80_04355 [Firmicutes bacterium]|nr:hypothetical protein [Bacillota bacterium]
MPVNPLLALVEMKDGDERTAGQGDPGSALGKSLQALFPGLKEPLLLIKKIYADNSLCGLLNGMLRVSDDTLNELTREALSGREEIKTVSFALRDGYLEGAAGLVVKNNPLQVAFRVDEIKVYLTIRSKEVRFLLAKPPEVAFHNHLQNVLLRLAMSIIRSLHGEGRINEILLGDLDGVTISGNEVTVDLQKVRAARQVVEAQILGVKILDLIRVDRVEMKEGGLILHGGLKIPGKTG